MITRRLLIDRRRRGLCSPAATGSTAARPSAACCARREGLTMSAQRLIIDRTALAREFSAADMSPVFRSNGNVDRGHARISARSPPARFADWRLAVDGLVRRPLSLSLGQIRRCRAAPRSPATIASRAGRRSASGPACRSRCLLDRAGLRHEARYIVFHCMDRFGDRPYYESIDLIDAFHPQTILAWALNDRTAARSPTARRCGSGSSASSATSTPSILMRIEARQPRSTASGAAAAAIGRIAAIMNGMRGSERLQRGIRRASSSSIAR